MVKAVVTVLRGLARSIPKILWLLMHGTAAGVLMMCYISTGNASLPFECVSSPLATCDDQRRFEMIHQFARVIQDRSVWQGRFDLHKMPLYIVHWDGKSAKRGFVLHATGTVRGATPLPPAVSHQGRVLRYDGRLKAAAATPNRLFDMPFDIAGFQGFMMLYEDGDPSTPEAIPMNEWIRILLHEAFHMYQFNWVYPAYGEQDDANYPFTRDVIALSLLEMHIVSTAYKTQDKSVHTDLLKMYTAVRTRKMAVEPGGKGLVRKMDNVQEYLEGSAKYFEVKAYEQLHPQFARDHFAFEIDDALKTGFQSKDEAREFFTFGMWYFTGAIVLRMMENTGIPFVQEMENGATPYDISKAHFSLSDAQLKRWQETAGKQFEFTKLVQQVEKYLNLK